METTLGTGAAHEGATWERARARLDARIAALSAPADEERDGRAGSIRRPSGPGLFGRDPPPAAFARYARAFGLDAAETDLLLIALAPELDPAYAFAFASLQADPRATRPTVATALQLAGFPLARAAQALRLLAPSAPLVRHRLLESLHPAREPEAPLPSRLLCVDPQVTLHLTGLDALPPQLADVAVLSSGRPALAAELDEVSGPLARLAASARRVGAPLRMYLRGSDPAARRDAVAAAAGALACPLLETDLPAVVRRGPGAANALFRLFREAWWCGAIVFVDGVDEHASAPDGLPERDLARAIAAHDGVVVLGGRSSWTPAGELAGRIVCVDLRVPGVEARRRHWSERLRSAGISLERVRELADAFQFHPAQIDAALVGAAGRAAWRFARERHAAAPARGRARRRSSRALTVTHADIVDAARSQCGHELDRLSQRIRPRRVWDDLVLPPDPMRQLRELCGRVAHRHRVLHEWGFDARLSGGKGATALFCGPSGTGKSLAAEVIGGALGLDVHAVQIASIVSRYVGDAEQRLEAVFAAAESANSILLFDEADALFGKRSEVRDSHDRYANLEVSYLLARMDRFDGLAILSTNFVGNLDPALLRRLSFTVHFPFPDEQHREKLWRTVWPAAVPLARNVNPADLARRFRLSGGNIRSAALAAAFLASQAGGDVTLAHVLHAVRREYQKMGRDAAELSDAPVAAGATA